MGVRQMSAARATASYNWGETQGGPMAGTAMARPKRGARPKGKARQAPGFKTIGIRVSVAYAEWLEGAAKQDRATIAAFIDRAVVERARSIGYEFPPPERLP